MECVFDIERIGKELGASVTAGFDGIMDAHFIWAANNKFESKIYYSKKQVNGIMDISIIEDSFIDEVRKKYKLPVLKIVK